MYPQWSEVVGTPATVTTRNAPEAETRPSSKQPSSQESPSPPVFASAHRKRVDRKTIAAAWTTCWWDGSHEATSWRFVWQVGWRSEEQVAKLVSIERRTAPFNLRVSRSFSFAFFSIHARCIEGGVYQTMPDTFIARSIKFKPCQASGPV